ncbi:MAG: hypothetical protein JWN52_5411 [Actinomycetia bacterium]|jgi:uncharacterized membrane protein YeaQ/YmgE (transglycosylase-associated protein family)|nr:hypothetical protein [Actinomycetes bacterium]
MTIGGIFTAIIFGAIIGAIGRLLVPGKQNMPIWLTVVVGIVAAFIGSWLARGVFGWSTRGFNIGETLLQIVVAAIGVLLVATFWPKKHEV